MNLRIFQELKKKIGRSDPVPLYYQLGRELEEMIENRTVSAGEKLPGDLLLSRILNVDHGTVRKAFSGLVEKGLIKRTPRAGTFVSETVHIHFPSIGFFYFIEDEANMLKRAEHVQNYLAQNDFDLKIIGFEEDYFERVDLFTEIRKKDLKGAIIVPLHTEECKNSLLKLEESRFPYVRFGNPYFSSELKAPLVKGNDRKRIKDVISHLWSLGHRKIGLVCCRRWKETEEEYMKFYEKKKGFETRWIMNVEFTGPPEQWKRFPGAQIARGYLEENAKLTAIIVHHSAVCIDFLNQAFAMDKNIPRDLSLMCLSRWEGLDLVSPPVTSMCLSEKTMGEKASEILLNIIRNGAEQKEKIIKIDSQLVERESVAPPGSAVEFAKAK